MFLTRKEVSLLWVFYLRSFIVGFSDFIGPYFVIYFSLKGFSYTHFSIAWAMLFISPIIFEIPTGAIADHFGRKFSTILGVFLTGVLFFIIPFVDSWKYLIVLMFIWGAVKTLVTGADDAWIVDNLKNEKQEKLIEHFYAKNSFLFDIGHIVSPLIAASIIVFYPMSLLWRLQGAGLLLIALILFFFTKEHYKKSNTHLKGSYEIMWKNTKNSFTYMKNHPVIFWLTFGFIFFAASGSIAMLSWQPMFQEAGIKLAYFGVLFSIAAIISAVGGLFTPKIVSKFRGARNLFIFSSIIAILFLVGIFFWFSMWPIIIVFVLFPFVNNLITIAESPYFHKYVPSKWRATIGSINSMFIQLGFGISFMVGGVLLDHIGVRNTILITAMLLIPAIIAYVKIKEPKSLKNGG